MKATVGDTVKIVLKSGENYVGSLLPDKKGTTILKLESGYNIGLKSETIKEIVLVRKREEEKKPLAKQKINLKLPTISILHTGGTIASKVDYVTGGVTARFSPEDILLMFPELSELANIRSRLVRNMMSENMRFAHYNLLAEACKEEIDAGSNGIIITQGTDTLYYSGAALSFVLENLGVPVIFVAAQRSSDRGSSDAYQNLLSAAYFIVKTDFAGVGICMHKDSNDEDCLILPGAKTRKMHSSRRDAFRPINTLPIATVNFTRKSVEYHTTTYHKRHDGTLALKPFKPELKVGILKCHTNMYACEVEAYKDFDGLVIEGLGLGQIPNTKIDEFTDESLAILKAVEKLAKKIPVVMALQTIYGRVNMNVYAEGRKNLEAGIIGNYHDMTPETTFIKLAWLLSNYRKEEIKELITTNLRGEINERLDLDYFLI